MWLAALLVCLVAFVAAGAVSATAMARYSSLYRLEHGADSFVPWRWQRDGRVTEHLIRVYSTKQVAPALERARRSALTWLVVTAGALVLSCLAGLASLRS